MNISILTGGPSAKPDSNSTIVAGGGLPLTITYDVEPPSTPLIEVALAPQASGASEVAYCDTFAAQGGGVYTGVLDLNDARLITALAGFSALTLDCQVKWTVGSAEPLICPNFSLTVEPPMASAPGTTEGGPIYVTTTMLAAALAGMGGGSVAYQGVIVASAPPAITGLAAAALNSNLATGGGTDDTAALQAMLDYLHAHGGGTLIINGAALISGVIINAGTRHYTALRTYPNVKIKGRGAAGLYLADHSYCTPLSNCGLGDTTQPYDVDVEVEGLTINCNGANQSYQELQGVGDGMSNMGAWFTGVDGLRFENITILNSPTFSVAFNRCKNIWVTNCEFLGSGVFGQGDGLHFYDVYKAYVNGIIHNGSDDCVALNFDEALFIHNNNSSGIFGYDRYTTSGGNANHVVVENVTALGSGHALAFNIYYAATGFDAVARNLNGESGTTGFHTGIQNKDSGVYRRFELDGYHALPGYNSDQALPSGIAFDMLRLNNIDPGISLGLTAANATNVSGDYFAAGGSSSSVIDGVTVTGAPSAGQVLTATGADAANWQTPSGGTGGSGVTPPIADWQFDDLTDSSGNSHTLTNVNGVAVAGGIAAFDESITPHQSLETADTIISGSFTLLINECNGLTSSAGYHMICAVNGDGSWNLVQFPDNSIVIVIGSTSSVASTVHFDGSAHKIRVRFNSATGALGIKVDGETEQVITGAIEVPTTGSFYLGNDARGYAFTGSMGEVKVWNYAMTDTDFDAL